MGAFNNHNVVMCLGPRPPLATLVAHGVLDGDLLVTTACAQTSFAPSLSRATHPRVACILHGRPLTSCQVSGKCSFGTDLAQVMLKLLLAQRGLQLCEASVRF